MLHSASRDGMDVAEQGCVGSELQTKAPGTSTGAKVRGPVPAQCWARKEEEVYVCAWGMVGEGAVYLSIYLSMSISISISDRQKDSS